MAYLTIPAYEASSPYIYVYYAEEDTRAAMPILARLYNEGLRMWSWNGSAQASDFRASQRINTCTALLIFLSDNLNRAVDRGDFEAMAALRCNKVKYFVRLSDVRLPFDWGKSDTNIVIDYVRSNEAAFWLSIYDSTLIEKCRGPWPEQPLSAALPSLDAFDEAELSDEYMNLSKIIDTVPATDKYGAPVNAEDIEIFGPAAGHYTEPDEELPEPEENEASAEERNRHSMDDLMDMLENISRSTREKAQALEESRMRRAQEQIEAAQKKTAIPFEQHSAPLRGGSIDTRISFIERSPFVEEAAMMMFGSEAFEPAKPAQETAEPEEEEVITEERTETVVEEEEPQEPSRSFEDFIDELAGIPPIGSVPDIPEEKPEPVEKSDRIYDFVLPDDDKEPETVHVFHDNDEGNAEPTPEERAAQAKKERRDFERAVNNAAYRMTGMLVARKVEQSTLNLRIKNAVPPTAKKIDAKVKPPVKVAPTPVVPSPLSEREQRREERRKTREQRMSEAASLPAPAVPEPPIEEAAPKRKFSNRPKVEEPAPVVEEPVVEEAAPKRKFSNRPKIEEPAPVVEEPVVEEAAPKRKFSNRPKIEEPAPVVEDPVVEESAPKRKFSNRPKVEDPAPAVEEPAVEESAPKRKFGSRAKAEEPIAPAEEGAPAEEAAPKRKFSRAKAVEPVAVTPEPSVTDTTPDTDGEEPEDGEEQVSKRKKGFPHKFSSTLEMLRELKAAQRAQSEREERGYDRFDFDEDDNAEPDGFGDESSGL